MYRATTPTHTFSFKGLDPQTFKVLNIYYAQQGTELLKKNKNDCVFSSKEIESGIIYQASVTLSQEETLMFKPKYAVKIQLRVLTADNRSLATPEYEIPVQDVINDEVLEE